MNEESFIRVMNRISEILSFGMSFFILGVSRPS
jgi:hypothetical protein